MSDTHAVKSGISSSCGNLPHWRRYAIRKDCFCHGALGRLGRRLYSETQQPKSVAQQSAALQVRLALLIYSGRIAWRCGHGYS